MSELSTYEALQIWVDGRAATRGTPRMSVTPYGWAGLAYGEDTTVRHVLWDNTQALGVAGQIDEPGTELKLLGEVGYWRDKLPQRWYIDQNDQQYLMLGPVELGADELPAHYDLLRQEYDGYASFSVTTGGESVSYASCGLAGHGCVFDSVTTVPQYRRRGLSTIVMQQLSRWASQRGASVSVLSASPMGKTLYESLGFEVVELLTHATLSQQ